VAERTRELEAANLELEAFSYSVSHDLRGPLHVIDGFSKALLEKHGEVLPPQALHYLNRIAAGAQSMNHLIEDLLGFAKGARAMLVRQDIDLAPLAQQVLAQLRQRFPQSPVQVGMDPSMPAVADPALIVVVLDNLIGNAWKFSSRGAHPRIEVASVQAAGAARVYRVCDNGAGFDMAHADKLFMPFQRLHSAAEFEGTGIGLATVRRIVERHGGRIWAQAAPGRGASFYFTLEPQPAA
jgi:light-regulated signal transduction histidine kinase (bacteriophytochrome)